MGKGLPACVDEDAPPRDSLPNTSLVVGSIVTVLVGLGVCAGSGS